MLQIGIKLNVALGTGQMPHNFFIPTLRRCLDHL